jgi:hypothetical protein
MAVKSKTADEKRHMQAVAELGCIACRKAGIYGSPAELHHIRETAGIGQRASHYEVIPLCYHHHRGTSKLAPSVHMSRKAFVEAYGSEKDLLDEVMALLGR